MEFEVLIMPLRVSDYMTPEVVVVSPKDTLARARNLMLHHNISRLVVVDKSNYPVGMLTESDMAMVIWRESGKSSSRPIDLILVEEVMSSPVKVIGPRTFLKNAAQVMVKNGFSSLPVIRGGELIGIITKTDITRAYAENYTGLLKVKDIMSSPVITVNPMHSIYRVGKLMNEYNISRIVVVEGLKPVGVVTETDLTYLTINRKPRKIIYGDAFSNRTARRSYKFLRAPIVADVMSPNPITIGLEEDSSKAASIMIENGISGLPVTTPENILKGIITKTDIVRAISTLKAR